jgi:pimeloyl-ACP methyl ester carboxylesterase/DNA-binding SARP family transcriptional activator
MEDGLPLLRFYRVSPPAASERRTMPGMDNRTLPESRAGAGVQLSLLGYPRLLDAAGRALPLKLKHGLALLAYLGVRAQPVGRDALAALLWPDAPPGVGRARLRRLLHELALRGAPGCIEGDADALWLAAATTSDVQRARAAMQAADAAALPVLAGPAAGSLLDGFALDSDAFDDWLQAERAAWRAALAHALERAVAAALAARDAAAAEQGALALLRLDPCAEAGHGGLITARALRGDAAGVEAAYFDGAERWRDEYGTPPSARVETAYALARARLQAAGGRRDIRYAATAHGQVAYASWGAGDETIVLLWGLMTNLEVGLDEPRVRALLDRLAERHRVVLVDRRGMGLSERVGVAADAASASEDVCAVLEAIGVGRAWLFGSSVGGTMALDIALRRPERVAGLLLFGTSASGRWTPETPWALTPERLDDWIERLADPAHYDEGLRRFAPSVADDPAVRDWHARLLRNAASRLGVAALLRAFHALDLRDRLHDVRVPTLVLQRRGDRVVPAAAGAYLAERVPAARLALLDGDDHFLWHGDADAVLREVEAFVARHRAAARPGGGRRADACAPR